MFPKFISSSTCSWDFFLCLWDNDHCSHRFRGFQGQKRPGLIKPNLFPSHFSSSSCVSPELIVQTAQFTYIWLTLHLTFRQSDGRWITLHFKAQWVSLNLEGILGSVFSLRSKNTPHYSLHGELKHVILINPTTSFPEGQKIARIQNF